ncbi:MAG TPA: pitrilysin family protein [Kofleriaceae bacterium]|jgi:zinc protease
MKLRWLVLVFVGLYAVTSCNPEVPTFAFNTAERRGTLPNGLRFVVMPDMTTKLVEVDVRYDVGSREDPIGKSGLAHLCEHLMFQARPDGPTSPPLFKAIMDRSTFFNAYTNWDTTHYMTQSQATPDNFDAMLKIESMRMYFGCKTIPEAEFEREREVVRNEIRAQSSAEGQIPQLIMAAIYPKGHAYERMIGGNDEQIASATLNDACEFMQKYYAPERATVVVAGGVSMDQAIGGIEKWFKPMPARKAAPRTPVAQFVPEHKTTTLELDVERPSVHIAWVLPPSNTPAGEAARFGIFSTFFRVARAGTEYGFAYSVEPNFVGGELAPVFILSIELKGMDKLDEALEFAKKAAAQAHRGFDEASYDDIQEDKALQKADIIESLEPLNGRTTEMANWVQFDTRFDFNSSQLYQFYELDKVDKFDQNVVGAVIKDALDWDKSVIVVVKPNKEGIKGDTRSKVTFSSKSDQNMDDADVDPNDALHPLLFKPGSITFDGLQQFSLDNGMKVMMLPIKAMPIVTAELQFKNAGTASSPDSPMLAGAAARFLRLPMGAEVFAKSGTNIRCRADLDAMTCGTHNINIYLDVMIRGLDREIKAGEYHQEEIEEWQKSLRELFQTKQEQQETEFKRQVFSALYGPNHPYTLSALQTPDSAAKVHKDALDSFRKDHYTAGNATLVIVGDFDPQAATKLVKDTFGSWDRGGTDKPVEKAAAKRTGPLYIGVIGKEQQQLTIEIAYPSSAGIDGQEGARQVLAWMLNRRTEDVRFKLGSTYGLYMSRQSHVGPTAYRLSGMAEVGGTIDAERAGESIKAIRDGFAALRNGDDFNADFVRARRKLIDNLLGQSTVTYEVAERLAGIAKFGLEPNHYDKLLDEIGSVPPALVKALMKTELDPNNEIIVMLGDRAHLEKAFADAGITDVKFVEPEYRK